VLVPGFTGSKEDFITVLGPLAEAGYRVVALDQRGQYQTPGPEDPAAYHSTELAADLLAVVTALGDGPVHLMGHSFGGLVCRAAALADPVALRSLTLMCSGPAALTGRPAERAALLLQALDVFDLPDLWKAILAVDAEEGNLPPEDPAIAAFLQRRFCHNHVAGLRAVAGELLDAPDQVTELAALTVPLMVTHGVDDDVWLPDVQAEMAQRLAARHVVIDGAGHSPAVEHPEATAAALVSFWQDVEAGAVLASHTAGDRHES
jgi:pimeloyl-ACP methyl ester carboxylesterase